MEMKTSSIGSIRRLLSLHSRSQIKQLLIDAGANKDRILPIPIVNDMKSKDYRSKAEILSLMFDPLYEDFDSNGAESVLINLVKLMFNNNTDFSPARLDVMKDVRNNLQAESIDFDRIITTGVTKPIVNEEISPVATHAYKYDVFICHASEDKDSFVRSLVTALHDKGLQVWYDEFSLTVGDSLRRSIDNGLLQSRFGIVVLSESFFAKEWPQKELDGLTAREINGIKVILPVWHDINRDDVLKHSPVLADRLGVQTSKGLEYVVDELLKAIKR